jgi:hypothetical protein
MYDLPNGRYAWDQNSILRKTDVPDTVTTESTFSPEQYGKLTSEYYGGGHHLAALRPCPVQVFSLRIQLLDSREPSGALSWSQI